MKLLRIAIDGPAGSGKSTIAKLISQRLSIVHLNTGAMYRAVTLYLLDNGIDLDDKDAIIKSLPDIKIDFENEETYLNDVRVTEDIRMPRVNENVSKVAAIKEVRIDMVHRQHEISKGKSIVMEGRDIGTKVLPNAEVKIFLTASITERAKRRLKDKDFKGTSITLDELIEDIKRRDKIDSEREESPLTLAKDGIELDTSDLTIDEVVEEIIKISKGLK